MSSTDASNALCTCHKPDQAHSRTLQNSLGAMPDRMHNDCRNGVVRHQLPQEGQLILSLSISFVGVFLFDSKGSQFMSNLQFALIPLCQFVLITFFITIVLCGRTYVPMWKLHYNILAVVGGFWGLVLKLLWLDQWYEGCAWELKKIGLLNTISQFIGLLVYYYLGPGKLLVGHEHLVRARSWSSATRMKKTDVYENTKL